MFNGKGLCNFLKEREECSICMENKVLHYFCNSHKFCHKCCRDWAKDNSKCPMCRQSCTNIDYIRYNYYLLDMSQDFFDTNNLEKNFKKWHKQSCIRKKHLFSIRPDMDWFNKTTVFHCRDCNVEQAFIINDDSDSEEENWTRI